MKIALAQLNLHIGNFIDNTQTIIQHINKAKAAHADIVVFSELSVCGYPPNDLLSFSTFVDDCSRYVSEIASHAVGIAVVIGAPEANTDTKGKPLFNTAYFLYNGQEQNKAYKALLPDYDVFDEFRYFEPSKKFDIIHFKGKKWALTVCEDLWNIGNEGLYHISPMDALYAHKPDYIINIAASPFDYTQQQKRFEILRANVLKYKLPLIYVNQVGAHTSLIFDGGSMVFDKKARIVECCDYFNEDFKIIDIELENHKEIHPKITSDIEKIHDALVLGIRDYFKKSGLKKAVLGLSGGIDSAVTLVLAVKALGAENVSALLLPSFFSSEHSVNDAIISAENLDVNYQIISITDIYNAANKTLESVFSGKSFDLTEENMQARIRALILMAYSNKFGHVLLNTSNKSETAVGYGTLYGDMCGAISVLGDVYKTQVYELAHYINRNKEIIPLNTILKPPSAELRFEQKDSDSLPEYDILDKILFEYIENARTLKQIIALGYEEKLVERVIRLVNTNEFKRFQSAPVLRVSPKAFGSGRQIPIVAKY